MRDGELDLQLFTFFLEKQTYLPLAKANLHRTPAETNRE